MWHIASNPKSIKSNSSSSTFKPSFFTWKTPLRSNTKDNEPEVPKAPKDPSARDYLIDQINSINLRLEDVSKGNKLKYPESKKIAPFRFPRANENYSAVRLVQNATTSYLNDLNLYGTDFDDDI